MIENPRPLSRLELQLSSQSGDQIEVAAQPALGANFPSLPAIPPLTSARVSKFGARPFVAGVSGVSNITSGCYSLRFRPTPPADPNWVRLIGTLRLERLDSGELILSGDVYIADPTDNTEVRFSSGAQEIPIFPRHRYFSYLRSGNLQGIMAFSTGPRWLEVECFWHRIVSIPYNLWALPEETVLRIAEPLVRGNTSSLIEGEVLDIAGRTVGQLELTWVSSHFRESVIEIDTETPLMPPLNNGTGIDWEGAMGRAGWRVRIETGSIEVPTPPQGGWTLAELHDAMLYSRGSHDLDVEWRYHIAVVRHLVGECPLGIAYDHEATDYNDVPREGVAVNAEARLPLDPIYGPYANQLLCDVPQIYFHVALHELGHAMGLYHNNIGPGVMRQVQDLAEDARSIGLSELPSEFDISDVYRLRHLPDIYVRPGGAPWETVGLVEDRDQAESRVAGQAVPLSRPEPEGPFELEAWPVESFIPAGAPLRVDFRLRNRLRSETFVPARLSLATPFVRGWVIGPDGVENEFKSLFKSIGDIGRTQLRAGEAAADSITLLRGHRGALFGRPGRHTLWLEVEWNDRGQVHRARTKFRFEMGAPESETHRRAARRLGSTPESLWYIAVGRSAAFRSGERAIEQALETPELRRHYAYLKARACSQRHYQHPEQWSLVAQLLAEQNHWRSLSQRERAKASHLATIAKSALPVPPVRSI